MKPLYTGFFPSMWCDYIDFNGFGANEADPCFLVSVDAAKARTEVAVAEVRVG